MLQNEKGTGSSASGIVGLILARGGSKGVLRKNIKHVAGLPLLAWVLRPMLKCKYFSSVWVSTDDNEIAETASQFGANVHMRSPNSARGTSSSLMGILDFLSHNPDVSVVGLVQCTSPCLTPKFLDLAGHMIIDEGYDSVFSVERQHKLRWKEVSPSENAEALNFDPCNRPRRQDWAGELMESGHFYFARVSLLTEGLLQGGRCGYVELPPELCFEIDTERDLVVAEQLLKMYGYRDDES